MWTAANPAFTNAKLHKMILKIIHHHSLLTYPLPTILLTLIPGLDVKVQWLTAEDDLVSEECEMNDQEVREIGDEFPSGATEPPQHPNCRCVMAPVVAESAE